MTTRKPAQDGGNVTNDLNSINLNTVNHSGAVSLEEDQRLFQPEQKRINDDYTNESVIKGEAKKIQNPPAVQLNMPKASENYVEVAPPINPDAAFSVHRNVNLVEEYEDYLRLEEYREQIMKNYHEKNSAEEDSSAGATESSKNVKNVAKRKNNVFLSCCSGSKTTNDEDCYSKIGKEDEDYKMVIEDDPNYKKEVIDESLVEKQKQANKASLQKFLDGLRGTQFGGAGPGVLTTDGKRLLIARIYYRNFDIFNGNHTRYNDVLQRQKQVWREIHAELNTAGYKFSETYERKYFNDFISATKRKHRSQDQTGGEPVELTEAEKYVMEFEGPEESTTGIRTHDLGASGILGKRKNRGIAAEKYTPSVRKRKSSIPAAPTPIPDSSEDEEEQPTPLDFDNDFSPPPTPTDSVASPTRPSSSTSERLRRSSRRSRQSVDDVRRQPFLTIEDEIGSTFGDRETDPAPSSSRPRNPSPSSTRPSSSRNISTTPSQSANRMDCIDGPITAGAPKMSKAKASATSVLMSNSKSMQKVADAFTTNASKRAALMDTISTTRIEQHQLSKEHEQEKHLKAMAAIEQENKRQEEKHRVEMEMRNLELERQKYELEKAKYELEEMKRKQQQQQQQQQQPPPQ